MVEMKNLKIEVVCYNLEVDIVLYSVFYEVFYDVIILLLDVLGYIKDNLVLDLSYCWSCCMVICGFCGMMVNNVLKLVCKIFLCDYIDGMKVEVLVNFLIECDLVVDMIYFIESLEVIKLYIIGNFCIVDQGINIQILVQMVKYYQFFGCINCGLCYVVCLQFGLNLEFIGLVVIMLVYCYNEDSCDYGKKECMVQLNSQNGVWSCIFVGYCFEVCLKYVDLVVVIQQGKVESLKDFFIVILKLC